MTPYLFKVGLSEGRRLIQELCQCTWMIVLLLNIGCASVNALCCSLTAAVRYASVLTFTQRLT